MVGIFNFYKLPFDIDFIVLCRLMKTCSLSKAPTRIFPHKLVETAKSVKSLGLKDNSTKQIRMKIYSEHIQTAWVETKTIKE